MLELGCSAEAGSLAGGLRDIKGGGGGGRGLMLGDQVHLKLVLYQVVLVSDLLCLGAPLTEGG